MEREEILNLSESKRIEIIKSPDDILLSNKYLNPKTKFYITLTLSEIKRKEIIKDNNIDLTRNDRYKMILTLSEKSRNEIAKNNNVEIKKDDRNRIILSLSQKHRYEIAKNKNVKLDFDSRMQIILSLDKKNIKKILEDKNWNYIEKMQIENSLNEDEQKDKMLGISEKSILKILEENNNNLNAMQKEILYSKEEFMLKLSEEARLKVFEKTRNQLSFKQRIEIISSFSDDAKIEILKNYNNFKDRQEILLYLSEESKRKILIDEKVLLSSPEKATLILSLSGDSKKEILKNKDIKLDSSIAKEIILKLDEDSKKEMLNDNIINLDSKENVEIILTLDKKDRKLYLKQLNKEERKIVEPINEILKVEDNPIEELKKFKHKIGDVKILDIPKDMTIGVELEAEGKNAFLVRALGSILPYWKSKIDVSIPKGVEVVSPILHDNIEDMLSLEFVCDLMSEAGLKTDELCGGHIHIGAKYLENNFNAWENLFIIWNETEELFYKMSNEKGKKPRQYLEDFAAMSHNDIEELYKKGKVKIENKEEFSKVCRYLTDTRSRGLNLSNLERKDKNTIEFRIPNGTINAKAIKENIKLFCSLLQVSKEIALNPEYKKEQFSNIKNRNLTEREKVETLLDLLFNNEEIKNIYRERWNSVKDEKIFDELAEEEIQTFKRGNYEIVEKESFKKIALDKDVIKEIISSDDIQKILEEIESLEQDKNIKI